MRPNELASSNASRQYAEILINAAMSVSYNEEVHLNYVECADFNKEAEICKHILVLQLK